MTQDASASKQSRQTIWGTLLLAWFVSLIALYAFRLNAPDPVPGEIAAAESTPQSFAIWLIVWLFSLLAKERSQRRIIAWSVAVFFLVPIGFDIMVAE